MNTHDTHHAAPILLPLPPVLAPQCAGGPPPPQVVADARWLNGCCVLTLTGEIDFFSAAWVRSALATATATASATPALTASPAPVASVSPTDTATASPSATDTATASASSSAAGRGAARVVVDVSRVTFCDSGLLRALLPWRTASREVDLAAPSEAVRRLLAVTRVGELPPCHSSVEQALERR
ncbi:STAS domain-containing protein [Streptomyces sp. 549]|uniref:STAS domain-containing protein n=1 Tax=Streptomyces sp. 549 TaxID=3049076 RepID=UPI0024C406B7|nr:STAS domain-containing protein [Streptomyces sp. 549]MDK1473007.1 STAS domain-containing protein [Streptomyces sp. 549]